MSTTLDKPTGSSTVSDGVRVEVQPSYLTQQSNPAEGQFVFGYHVRIANLGSEIVQLLARHWVVVDADGTRREIRGEGVVGQCPRLRPGEIFEYDSFCPLATRWGTMEGSYAMRRDDGSTFSARIARFYLVGPADE